MEPKIRPTTIWAICATFGFVSMFGVAIWQNTKVEDLKAKLASAEALELVQDAHARGLQNRLETARGRINESENLLKLCLDEVDEFAAKHTTCLVEYQ